MSKKHPDRHPKLKGDHGLLPAFRKWFQKCERHEAILSIIPSEIKKDPTQSIPESRWKRAFGPTTLIQASQEPVAATILTYGPLTQEVRIIAKSHAALQAIGLAV